MADGSVTSSGTRTVYLVRHGDTAANESPERERGWSNIGLDDDGRKDARNAAKKLARLGIKAIVSSDLPRAKQSAKIIGDWLGIEPDFHAQIRTWNTGELASKPKTEVEPILARLVRNAPDRAPLGGESFDHFWHRVFAGFADALATHPQNPLAFIIHNRVERLLEAWTATGEKPDHAIKPDVFLAKGECPGHIEKWTVNPASLRLSHAEADYDSKWPAETTGDRCEICKAYRGPDKCTKVRQPISPDGWCAVGVSKTDGHAFG